MSIEKKQKISICKKSVHNNRNIFTGINERLFKLIFYTNKEKNLQNMQKCWLILMRYLILYLIL